MSKIMRTIKYLFLTITITTLHCYSSASTGELIEEKCTNLQKTGLGREFMRLKTVDFTRRGNFIRWFSGIHLESSCPNAINLIAQLFHQVGFRNIASTNHADEFEKVYSEHGGNLLSLSTQSRDALINALTHVQQNLTS